MGDPGMPGILTNANTPADSLAFSAAISNVYFLYLHIKEGLNRLANLNLVGGGMNFKYISIESLDPEGRLLGQYRAQQYSVI